MKAYEYLIIYRPADVKDIKILCGPVLVLAKDEQSAKLQAVRDPNAATYDVNDLEIVVRDF